MVWINAGNLIATGIVVLCGVAAYNAGRIRDYLEYDLDYFNLTTTYDHYALGKFKVSRRYFCKRLPCLTTTVALAEDHVRVPTVTHCLDLVGLHNLTTLTIWEEPLYQFPCDICTMHSLTNLALDFNNLVEIPEDIARLTNLELLFLSHNALTTLPYGIGMLKRLKEIRLHKNNLQSLPDSIGDLTKLRFFNVSDNNLRALPSSICELPEIKELYVGGNRELRELPPNFGALQSLVYLSIEFTAITAFPRSFQQLDFLFRLTFTPREGCLPPKEFGGLRSLYKLNTIEHASRGDCGPIDIEPVRDRWRRFVSRLHLIWVLKNGEHSWARLPCSPQRLIVEYCY